MQKIIILASFFHCVASFAGTVTFTASYRDPANLFVIMDCVSGWWDNTFCYDDGAYQAEWKKRFGITDEDKKLFAKYDSFRQK